MMSLAWSGVLPLSASTVADVSVPVAASSTLLLEFLHRVGNSLVVGGAAVAEHVEPFTQRRHAVVLHAGLEHRTSGSAILSACFSILPARISANLALSALYSSGLRLVGVKCGGDVAWRLTMRGEHVGGLRRLLVVFDVRR